MSAPRRPPSRYTFLASDRLGALCEQLYEDLSRGRVPSERRREIAAALLDFEGGAAHRPTQRQTEMLAALAREREPVALRDLGLGYPDDDRSAYHLEGRGWAQVDENRRWSITAAGRTALDAGIAT